LVFTKKDENAVVCVNQLSVFNDSYCGGRAVTDICTRFAEEYDVPEVPCAKVFIIIFLKHFPIFFSFLFVFF